MITLFQVTMHMELKYYLSTCLRAFVYFLIILGEKPKLRTLLESGRIE